MQLRLPPSETPYLCLIELEPVIGPLHDPVTWYGINYTGTQITQWDFQNKGKSGWTGASSFVLEVPLRNLRPGPDRVKGLFFCSAPGTVQIAGSGKDFWRCALHKPWFIGDVSHYKTQFFFLSIHLGSRSYHESVWGAWCKDRRWHIKWANQSGVLFILDINLRACLCPSVFLGGSPSVVRRHSYKQFCNKVCVLYIRYVYSLAPSYICDLLTSYTPSRQLRSSSKHLVSPCYNLKTVQDLSP